MAINGDGETHANGGNGKTDGNGKTNFPNMHWDSDRWKGIERPYTYADVDRLRGSLHIEYTLAKVGAERFWNLLQTTPYVSGLGAVTGNQAVQMVKAGLPSIYVSGWQVAADANLSAQTYPDQSLYPADSVPALCKRINNALMRADQIAHAEGKSDTYWYAPLIADAEAGFGGVLNAFELMKQMIEAGAAAVHFEDQLSSAKKCGHLGGKVLVPTQEGIQKLVAARLAADVLGVETVLIARTDANSAQLITSDVDPRDREFIVGSERTHEGFYRVKGGIESAIARGVAYAPYCDLIWCETSEPNLEEARTFAEGVHKHFPGKMLAYNCSPSFNWKKKLDEKTIARFRDALAEMGFKYQFITLAGFHAMNLTLFEISRGYNAEGMTAYSRLQQREFELESQGYEAIKHQKFVGTGYFDEVTQTITGGLSSVTALKGSTEEEQFLAHELHTADGEGMPEAPHRTPTSPAELAKIDPLIAGDSHAPKASDTAAD
jgi:isocitrate lyase